MNPYKGNEVIAKPACILEMEGHSAAFCECGYTLYIKTPEFKGWYPIECPHCKKTLWLYCGLIPGYINEDLPIL